MEENEKRAEENTSLYYIIGAVALVVVIAVGYFLRPKPSMTPQAPEVAVVPTPTPGPITQLACESQYFNPVVALPGVYLSAAGGDLTGVTKEDCTFNVSVNNKVVATENVTATTSAAPERNGQVWTCTTKALDLQKGVATTVDVKITNDQNKEATCSAAFVFP